MELKLSEDNVTYDPKTNEYTVKINLEKLGSLYGVPIYCYNVDLMDYYKLVSIMNYKFTREFREFK